MTQEEKLKEAKRLYQTANADQRYVLESLFPELVESEDEMIRRGVIEYLQCCVDDMAKSDCPFDFKTEIEKLSKYIDWLEKQGDTIKIKKGKNYLCTKTHKYAGVEWIEGVKYYSPEDYSLVNQGCTCYCPKYSKEEHNNFFKEDEYNGCLENQGKQGEQLVNSVSTKKFSDEVVRKAVYYTVKNSCYNYCIGVSNAEMLNWIEKQGAQKSDNKIEPMFKIGDCVVINGFVLKILGVCSDLYETTFLQSGEWRIYDMYVLDNNAHIWSIQDAKPGDVLVASDGSLFIFAKVKDNSAYYYFSLCKNGSKEISDGNHAWETANSCYPATKEQSDFLFQEIRKAGYEWDIEKKELKMIKNHIPKPKRR